MSVAKKTIRPNETRIGIDIGGTFTDFVVYRSNTGQISSFKLLSTPENPAKAVLSGLEQILRESGSGRIPSRLDIIHGSTVATNALLERKGARTALITTHGFRDVLQIGRQNRPALYDFFCMPPPPLVPPELRFEVQERVDHHGDVLESLNPCEVDELIQKMQPMQIESVAVCFLFSFLHPEHERILSEKLRETGVFVSISSEILPEYREYERTSTTVVNAYVSPVQERYLSQLERQFGAMEIPGSFRVMQSNGGSINLQEAKQNGVRCILSGPAGGLVGAHFTANLTHTRPDSKVQLITFDMGGTSTDVSLIDDIPLITTESVIGGFPIRIPVLDIHTIGAGGGSIAAMDAGGALRVGPVSAGADPGPACYGHGWQPTVTDANLLLGRIPPEHFLGGKMPLDYERANTAISILAGQLRLSPIETALGIIEIVNANMERALRVISVERGYDPRDFTLLSFGGAGGLHSSNLARRIGSPRVLIPPLASTLSAFGMLASDLVKDYTQTVMLPGKTPREEILTALKPLRERGLYEIHAEGIALKDIQIEEFLDVRYQGQSYELTIPLGADINLDFHTHHQKSYGYCRPGSPLEIVNIRVRATGFISKPDLQPKTPHGFEAPVAKADSREVYLPGGPMILPLYLGDSLRHKSTFPGPALVVREDTTIMVENGDLCQVDEYGNLWIEITGKPPA